MNSLGPHLDALEKVLGHAPFETYVETIIKEMQKNSFLTPFQENIIREQIIKLIQLNVTCDKPEQNKPIFNYMKAFIAASRDVNSIKILCEKLLLMLNHGNVSEQSISYSSLKELIVSVNTTSDKNKTTFLVESLLYPLIDSVNNNDRAQHFSLIDILLDTYKQKLSGMDTYKDIRFYDNKNWFCTGKFISSDKTGSYFLGVNVDKDQEVVIQIVNTSDTADIAKKSKSCLSHIQESSAHIFILSDTEGLHNAYSAKKKEVIQNELKKLRLELAEKSKKKQKQNSTGRIELGGGRHIMDSMILMENKSKPNHGIKDSMIVFNENQMKHFEDVDIKKIETKITELESQLTKLNLQGTKKTNDAEFRDFVFVKSKK